MVEEVDLSVREKTIPGGRGRMMEGGGRLEGGMHGLREDEDEMRGEIKMKKVSRWDDIELEKEKLNS